MKIKFGGVYEKYGILDLEGETFNQLLAGLKFRFGQELIDTLKDQNSFYIFLNETDESIQPIAMHPNFAASSITQFDTLIILPEIRGETGIEVAAGAAGATAAATVTFAGVALATMPLWAAIVVAGMINIALSMALSAVMQLISPTPEFGKDPSKVQKAESNLFNGVAALREQGGSVPLIFGNPFFGGAVISSSITTEQVKI